MLALLRELTGSAAGACPYADARHVVLERRRIAVRNGTVERVVEQRSEGIGVRVRAPEGWAFAATADVSAAGAQRALARALELARAQPQAAPGAFAPAPAAAGHWSGPCERDPLAVPLEEQCELLLAADAALRGDPRVVRSQATCFGERATWAFASSEGAACTQEKTECGAGIAAVAVADGELQTRSYPGGHGGSAAAAGWEYVVALDLPAQAPRVAEEAVALLTAPPCPAGVTTVVLHGEQVALQLHESVGHALELDRILGLEASYAGTSWVSAPDIGRLRYGSELMNVTADATLPGGLGSFGWDDEGVAAGAVGLVRDGVLEAALSSRESAAAIGLPASAGCMRAEGWDRQPIVRMTNVSLEAGAAGTLADLIAATDSGLYLESNRSWSIDDRRLQFQFATEVGREIRDGELGRLYRNPSYAGVTPVFWGSLDAVCSRSEWTPWGVVDCGKGEPGQVAHVSHGTAPARFRDVQVGVA